MNTIKVTFNEERPNEDVVKKESGELQYEFDYNGETVVLNARYDRPNREEEEE